MDRETVIRLAKEAKLIIVTGAHEQGPDRDRLERFAALVAAAVKEEDAKIAEKDDASCCNFRVAKKIRASINQEVTE